MQIKFDRQEGPNYFFKAGWITGGKEIPGVPAPCAIADLVYPPVIELGETIGSWESPANLQFVACSIYPMVNSVDVLFDIGMELSGKLGFLYVNIYEIVYQEIPEMTSLPLEYYDNFGRSEPDGDGHLVTLPLDNIYHWSPNGDNTPCWTPMEFYNKNFSISSAYTKELVFLIPPGEDILTAVPSYTLTWPWGDYITIHRDYFEPSVTLYTQVDTPCCGVIGYNFPPNPSSGMTYAKIGIPCNPNLRVYLYDYDDYAPPIGKPFYRTSPVIPVSWLSPLSKLFKTFHFAPDNLVVPAFELFQVSGEDFYVSGEGFEVR